MLGEPRWGKMFSTMVYTLPYTSLEQRIKSLLPAPAVSSARWLAAIPEEQTCVTSAPSRVERARSRAVLVGVPPRA